MNCLAEEDIEMLGARHGAADWDRDRDRGHLMQKIYFPFAALTDGVVRYKQTEPLAAVAAIIV